MFLALQIVRQYPTQIEADLEREYGRDILDWYRGELSSRKLLVLLEELSDNASLKKEFSESGWPEWVQILAEIHKEDALNRAGKYAGTKHAYEVKTFVPPKERLRKYIEVTERTEFQKEVQDDLFEQLGWT